MAYLPPTNPEELQPQASPVVSAPPQAQPAGTGFVNLSRMLGLNQGIGQQMGGALASQFGTQADAAKKSGDALKYSTDAGYAGAKSQAAGLGQQAEMLGDFSGRQIALQNAYAHPGYNLGQQQMDSAIVGGSPGWDARTSGFYGQAGGLQSQLGGLQAQAPQAWNGYNASAPPAQTAKGGPIAPPNTPQWKQQYNEDRTGGGKPSTPNAPTPNINDMLGYEEAQKRKQQAAEQKANKKKKKERDDS